MRWNARKPSFGGIKDYLELCLTVYIEQKLYESGKQNEIQNSGSTNIQFVIRL
jgi:hypothetical protein